MYKGDKILGGQVPVLEYNYYGYCASNLQVMDLGISFALKRAVLSFVKEVQVLCMKATLQVQQV